MVKQVRQTYSILNVNRDTNLPDVFVSVHVHGVELLHLFLTWLLLHVLKHLISYVLWKDGEQQTFLWRTKSDAQRTSQTATDNKQGAHFFGRIWIIMTDPILILLQAFHLIPFTTLFVILYQYEVRDHGMVVPMGKGPPKHASCPQNQKLRGKKRFLFSPCLNNVNTEYQIQ